MAKNRNDSPRARKARESSKIDRRAARNKVIILVMAVLMALSLLAVPLISLFDNLGGGDDPAADGDLPELDDLDAPEEPIDPEDVDDPCPEPTDVPENAAEIRTEPYERTIDEDASYTAIVETTCGDIVIALDVENAPEAVNNLVNLAEDGYYDGVIFHRIVPGFVVQTGDPAGTGCGREDCSEAAPDEEGFPGYRFGDELEAAEVLYEQVRAEQLPAIREELAELEAEGIDLGEIGLSEDVTDEELLELIPGGYPRGIVAMANAGPDTNGSQFFVTLNDPTGLPGPSFTVLGEVVEGMDVVDAIAASTTDATDRPVIAPVIRTVRIEVS
ncbi:MAG: peptidylprolyl isomerase [Nitriliruptoraceae bacterium]|nr:peptidylprolyl isomerase [Nitriliruptoraceae bacterium]